MKVQGACARVINPTTRMSTPILRIQSGMAIHTRPSGSPDENDSRTTEAVRQERIASDRLASVPGGRGGGAVVETSGAADAPAAISSGVGRAGMDKEVSRSGTSPGAYPDSCRRGTAAW